MNTNTSFRIFRKKETNYGGGDGGIEFSETHATATTGYVAFNYLAGDVKLNAKKFKRKKLKAPGVGATRGMMITTGAEFPDVEIPYYQQGNENTLGALAVAGVEGAVGDSYTFNIVVPSPDAEDGSETWTIFGAQLKSYKIEGEADSDTPPKITTIWSCYSIIKDTGAVDFSAIAVPTTAVQEWEDYSVEIDDAQITELKSFAFLIENKWTELGSGRNSSYAKFKPRLLYTDISMEIKYYEEATGLITEAPSIATLDATVKVELLTGITTEEFDCTNMYVDESNMFEFTGDDIKEVEYTVKYVSGDSVLTKVSP